jgi:regulator of replication initiation timing
MTDPDPLADLAAQFAELRGQLARSQGEIGALRERIEAGSGQAVMFRLEVKQLREDLAEAVDKHQLKPPPAPWWCVGEAEGRAMLAELHEWVDGFARRHYPGYMARLPRCWASHPEAVWELSTLHAEWTRIYGDEDNRDLQGALAWHDKWLPGVLGRLAAAVKCDEAGCRVTRPRAY